MTTTFLTKEGYQKLADELEYLRTAKRKEVAERLHEAMEGGELIENAEYEAAKNEQAFVEGRIQELEMILASARIIEEQDKNRPPFRWVIRWLSRKATTTPKNIPLSVLQRRTRAKAGSRTNLRWAGPC